jgi:methanogenic corrinoid protein MtbC1
LKALQFIECLPLQEWTIKMLEATSLREKVKVMVGGAITSEMWARKIGADAGPPMGRVRSGRRTS